MTAPHEIAGTGPSAGLAENLRAIVPELQTERLRLRAPRLQDFPVLADIHAGLASVSQRASQGRDGAWAEFMQMTATWLLRGHGWWTVDDATGVVGFVGIGFEPGDQAPELGYLLDAAARGKGYATEAGSAARDHARDIARLPALVSYVSDENAASRNVARKLGARRDSAAEADLGEDGVQVWRHWGSEARGT